MNEPTPRGKKMAIAAALATLIAVPAEGLRQVAYRDPPGIWTACRGHTGPDVQQGVRYSLAQCDAWMDQDMKHAVMLVDRCAPDAPPNVLAAFSDAAYNLGPKIACDTRNSTAARLLKAGDWAGACKQLLRWDKANLAGLMVALPGLTKRRAAESKLCLQGLPQ